MNGNDYGKMFEGLGGVLADLPKILAIVASLAFIGGGLLVAAVIGVANWIGG